MACTAVFAMAALPVQGQDDVSRADLEALEAEREETLRQLAILESAGGVVAGDLEKLERDLISAAMESQRREEQATSTELKLVSLRSRLAAARTDLVEGEDALEDLMASLAISGRHRPPALLTQPKSANQAIRAAILMGEVAPEVRSKTKVLGEEITELRRLERNVLREQKTLAAADAALALKREEIIQLTTAKRAAFEDVNSDAEILRQHAESLGEKAGGLRDLILALEAAAPAAPRLKPRLALAENSQPRPTQRASLPRATVSQPLGVLALPASGRVVRAWGDKMPGGAKSESVAFATRSGAQVSAPISGTVEFAGPFRSYGQLLILSTSDGYHVLLWGMSSSYVAVGQSVQQGEPVARMAERAGGEPELYLEVRKGGEPMDPANWMKRG
ncbi:MAG: peptidoglycan DD-metalloendopeptidase family protein [Henriciella sp.]|nr:peptidoglycan DD-metalloendopeptidase family protein [Henriciella sp.]